VLFDEDDIDHSCESMYGDDDDVDVDGDEDQDDQ
jgi:hypothetical protein